MNIEQNIENALNFTKVITAEKITENVSEWMDPIEYTIKRQSGQNSRMYVVPSARTCCDHIHRRLGHLSVNPIDKLQTEAIQKVYVFPNKANNNYRYANNNDESIFKFIEELQEKAKQAHFLATQQVDGELDRSRLFTRAAILYGHRGCGKTFFLNYLLSRFSKDFDSNKILWVRINLAASLGFKGDVLHWIYAQTGKIILRYYDQHSEYFKKNPKQYPINAFDYLMSEISEIKDDRHAKIMFETIKSVEKSFQLLSQDDQLSPERIPLYIGQTLASYAKKIGYAIIVVLDGLDQLDASVRAKERYDILANASFRIATSSNDHGFFIVLVMRTATLAGAEKLSLNPFLKNIPRPYEILDPQLEQILQVRIKFIKNEIKKLEQYPDFSERDWDSFLDEFQEYLYSIKENNLQAINFLEKLYEKNKRAEMQAIQMSFHEYLVNRRTQIYRLIECLMKAGWSYPPRYYSYSMSDNSELMIEPASEIQNFDYRFFPSIFRFPHLESNPDNKNLCPSFLSIMHGIRILQFLLAYEKMNRETSNKHQLFIEDISVLCDEGFGYDKNVTTLILEEFNEYELIRLIGIDRTLQSNIEIQILPKLDKVYQYATNEIAYLNLAAMRLPLPKSLYKTEKYKKNPFVFLTSLENINQSNIESWIFTKAYNAIQMYRIISQINEYQKKQFEIKNFKKAFLFQIASKAKYADMFTFINNLKRAIKGQIMGAIKNREYFNEMKTIELSQRIFNAVEFWKDGIDD